MFGYVKFLIDQLQYKISTILESTREKEENLALAENSTRDLGVVTAC